MGQMPCHFLFWLQWLPIYRLYITATKSQINYCTYKTKNYGCSVDTHNNVLSIQHLLPLKCVLRTIWTDRQPFWLIETWPCGKAEPSNIFALFAFILLKFIYVAKWFIARTILTFINGYSHATVYHSPVIYLYMKLPFRVPTVAGETYWCILSYHCVISLFLVVSNEFTVTNGFLSSVFDFSIGWINLDMFGVAVTFHCSALSGWSVALCSSMYDSMSAGQLSLLSYGVSKLPFQFRQFSCSQMLSGALYLSFPTEWQSILLIQRIFNTSVCPTERSFADKVGGKGDLSNTLNAATPSSWKSA